MTGSSAANWSRAAAASPACPVQWARLARARQGLWVLRAEYSLDDGHQRGELVAGRGRIARLPGPPGEVGPGGQGVRVLRAEDPLTCFNHPPVEFAGGHVTAAEPEVVRDSPHPDAVSGEGRLGVRQQRGEIGPGIRPLRVFGDRGADHCGGSLAPRGQLRGHLIGGDRLHQPVHRYRPVDGRADQRIPAQRGDRVLGCQRVLQQRQQHLFHLRTQPFGESRAGLQQQAQRDRLGRAARQQPQQSGRRRGSERSSRPNASAQVVATVLPYPAGSPRPSSPARRCRNNAR